MASLTSPRGKGNLEIVRKMWHWSSMEYDEKFLILGMNTLHNIAFSDDDDGVRSRGFDIIPEEEIITTRAPETPWFKRIFKFGGPPKHTDELPLNASTVQINLEDRQSSVPRLPVTDSKRHRVSQYAQKKFRRESHELRANKEYSLGQADDIFDNFEDFTGDHYHPRMLRLWIWLIKLDDNTIITLHEPFPPFRSDVATPEKKRNTTANVRRNLRMVLRCLSTAGMPKQDADGSDAYSAELAMEHGALIVRQTVRRPIYWN
ncbi:hypothetical protein ABW19_dt0204994 [Dactylella cylindrospora]|nr:hypothetical protein ABW19_dt0204994 [Dactylella cylindrospora]